MEKYDKLIIDNILCKYDKVVEEHKKGNPVMYHKCDSTHLEFRQAWAKNVNSVYCCGELTAKNHTIFSHHEKVINYSAICDFIPILKIFKCFQDETSEAVYTRHIIFKAHFRVDRESYETEQKLPADSEEAQLLIKKIRDRSTAYFEMINDKSSEILFLEGILNQCQDG
jgi:hypothetical protein